MEKYSHPARPADSRKKNHMLLDREDLRVQNDKSHTKN